MTPDKNNGGIRNIVDYRVYTADDNEFQVLNDCIITLFLHLSASPANIKKMITYKCGLFNIKKQIGSESPAVFILYC